MMNAETSAPRAGVRPQSRMASAGWIWAAAALVLIAAPLVFSSRGSLTSFNLIGIAIIFALSYNILLGETGLLSFGHAVPYGFGGFAAAHAMNAIAAHGWPIPLPAVPLLGGFGGLAFALVLGWVMTKRAGTVFAMISLGVGELIASSSLILRSVFGGESGVATDRTALAPVFGLTFGPQLQLYYLVAAWVMISAAAMYALTRTPLGRMCNAVRDNPTRVEFIGYDPQVIRYLAFAFAGFFAGVAGGLAAIHFEIANSAYFGSAQSGVVLFATFTGGAGSFFGPILGAILVTWLQLGLSNLTSVWQLYFGLLFIGIVMFAPQGLAGLVTMHRPLLRAGAIGPVLGAYALALLPTLALACGAILAIEIAARLSGESPSGAAIDVFGVALDSHAPTAWAIAAALTVGGFIVARATWRRVAQAWERAGEIAQAQGRRA